MSWNTSTTNSRVFKYGWSKLMHQGLIMLEGKEVTVFVAFIVFMSILSTITMGWLMNRSYKASAREFQKFHYNEIQKKQYEISFLRYQLKKHNIEVKANLDIVEKENLCYDSASPNKGNHQNENENKEVTV